MSLAVMFAVASMQLKAKNQQMSLKLRWYYLVAGNLKDLQVKEKNCNKACSADSDRVQKTNFFLQRKQ